MKKAKKSVIIVSLFLLLQAVAYTQSPPHPNGGNIPGSGNTPVGGGAPIGSGLIIFGMMAFGYGIKKFVLANWNIGIR